MFSHQLVLGLSRSGSKEHQQFWTDSSNIMMRPTLNFTVKILYSRWHSAIYRMLPVLMMRSHLFSLFKLSLSTALFGPTFQVLWLIIAVLISFLFIIVLQVSSEDPHRAPAFLVKVSQPKQTPLTCNMTSKSCWLHWI